MFFFVIQVKCKNSEQLVSNMIIRNKTELPKNYHLSIAKMIDDVLDAGFANFYEGLKQPG